MIATLLLIAASGCKPNKKETAALLEESGIARAPNKSDTYFAKAITQLENRNAREAATSLDLGLKELRMEGKDVTGLYRNNLDKAMGAISMMSGELKKDSLIALTPLREQIANAEINVAHSYLSASDVYVLEEPDAASAHITRQHFNRTLGNLKKEVAKYTPQSKTEGQALLKEGKKLEQEYQDWEKRAAAHVIKANEHFNKYYPEYYDGDIR